jgi:hypothetical protein
MKHDDPLRPIVLPTNEERCSLCGEESLIEVSTTTNLDIRDYGPLAVPSYMYYACDNPTCGLEFVTAEQARQNERSILAEKLKLPNTDTGKRNENQSN